MAYERQYYTNGDVLDARQMNHMETGIKENSDNIDKLSRDIATKASAIKETASGETIVVTDSDEQKPLGLAIDGKSEQNQYSGKNLLQNTCDFTEYMGVVINVNENGTIGLKGTATANDTFHINSHIYLADGNYIYSIGENLKIRVLGYQNGWVEIKKADAGGIVEFTTDSNLYSNYMVQVGLSMGISYDTTIYPMIRLASITDDTYEPYCGGIPSPNPSYPQEIRNIGVYDEASGKYAVEVKCTGKNWLQNNATSKTDGGVDFIVNDDKSVTINGVSTADVYLNLDFMAGGIPTSEYNVVTETEMVASFDNKVNGIQMAVGYFDESGKGVNMLSVDTADRTFIYPKTAVKARTYLYIQSGKTFNNVTVYPMIRPVGTDESYEPWKKPITATVLLDEPLRKGDKAYWNGGSKVRVDRYRAVEVFDGSENWKKSNATSRYGVEIADIKNIKENDTPILLSDRYIAIIGDKYNNYTHGISSAVSTIYVTNTELQTIEEFKTALTENPLKVEYELATPITEEIDIDLGELSMFYPTTILSNDCNANMEVTYVADTKAYIDKKFAELATAMV